MEEDLLKAEQVVLQFFKNVVWYFSIPTSIVHDQDPRFTSEFWQYLWKLLGSCAKAIFAHHSQVDGQTECMNCTICKILYIHLLDDNQEH